MIDGSSMTTVIQNSLSIPTTVQQRSMTAATRQGSLTQRLNSIKERATKITVFVEDAALEIAETFNAVFALLEFESNGTTITREFIKEELDSTDLAALASSMSIETQVDGEPHAKVIDNFLVMTCPLVCENKAACGAFSIYVPFSNPQLQEKLTKSFERTIQWMLEAARDFKTSESQPEMANAKSLTTLQKAAGFETLTHLCFGLANNYCEKLGCDRAAIGLLSKNGLKIELMSVSGTDQIKSTSPNMIQIQQAQEECLDAGRCISINSRGDLSDKEHANFLIHSQWHQKSGGASVASIPVSHENKIVGVLSLQRQADQPFDAEELQRVENSISNFVPAIGLMKKAHRTLRDHWVEDYAQYLPRLLRSSWAAKLAAFVVLIFLFGWIPYYPTFVCSIEPDRMSRLVAPFDGVLASVEHLPGDHVAEGDIVLRFDTRQLESERVGLVSQINAKRVQRDIALTERQTATAKVLDAEMHVLETQLDATLRKIEQCALKSSLDGHVLRGDLRPEVGQTIPSGTALAEIAPVGGMKLKIQIPESKANEIQIGATGYFVAESNPAEYRSFKIVRTIPSTEIVDGRNVIIAEAEVIGACDWMKSGMKGYAKVDLGWSPIIGIVGRDFWDALRLGFWL